MPLDTDDLCNKITGFHSMERAMHHWQNTRSPMVYWTRDIIQKSATDGLSLWTYFDERIVNQTNQIIFEQTS